MGEERGWWHGHLLREKDEVRSLSDMASAMDTVENGREIQLNRNKIYDSINWKSLFLFPHSVCSKGVCGLTLGILKLMITGSSRVWK